MHQGSRFGRLGLGLAVTVAAATTTALGAAGDDSLVIPTPSPVPVLGSVLVTAVGGERAIFDTPYTTEQIDRQRAFDRAYRTLPQALRDVPGVLVQETSAGQGSPFIRGFTAQRNVLLIDGVRVNNSVFRPGPNQYWSTVDPFGLDRIEIVKGPSSVLYGSDAIGGTVQAFTRDPFGYGEGTNLGGRAVFRVASAERSFQQRGEVSLTSGENFGFLAGVTGRIYNDVQTGGGTQPNVAYDEYDTDFKSEYWINDHARVVAMHQRVRQNNVPRTHKTVFAQPFDGTSVGGELQRDLDQERELTYVQFHADDLPDGPFTEFHAGVSYQRQSELRHRIRTPSGGPGNRVDFQGFDVDTVGLFVRAASDTPIGKLTYGAEYYRDNVNSFKTSINSLGVVSQSIQGPVADDASYDLFGLFVQDQIDIGDRLVVIVGGRFTYARAEADKVVDPSTGLQFSLADEWANAVGSARATFALVPDHVNVFGGVSQGFRTPNLSDLTRFDTARSGEFEIPAPGLDPEYFTTFELGAKARNDQSAVEVSAYYTVINDMILRTPTGVVTPAGVQVINSNVGDGYLYGIELAGSQRVAGNFTVFGNIMFMEGQVSTFPTSAPFEDREFLDRLMPLTGQVGVRWDDPNGKVWIEALARGADKADRLSTRDTLDTQRIPAGGTPGYVVADLVGGGKINHAVTWRAGIENLFNENYRVHGSGSNMPGISFVFGVDILLD